MNSSTPDNTSVMFLIDLSSFLQQSTEINYPEVLLIAINRNGVMLINPQNKVRLHTLSLHTLSLLTYTP